LIVSPSHFAQYIEGEEASLERVMASIRRDERHTDLVVWEPVQLPTRRFPNWRMALFGPDERITRAMNPILAELNGTMPDPQRVEMLGLMQTLAKTYGRLADTL
jgi:ribosomal protein S10